MREINIINYINDIIKEINIMKIPQRTRTISWHQGGTFSLARRSTPSPRTMTNVLCRRIPRAQTATATPLRETRRRRTKRRKHVGLDLAF